MVEQLIGLLLGPRLQAGNEGENQLVQLEEGVLWEIGDHYLGQVCHKIPVKDTEKGSSTVSPLHVHSPPNGKGMEHHHYLSTFPSVTGC